MLPHRPPSWFDAWVECAYGPEGFWRQHLPDEHFATAATTGPQLAHRVGELLEQHPTIGHVIDLGAGDGALLTDLDRFDLELTAVDLRARPAGLDGRVDWVSDLWDVGSAQWTDGAAARLLAAGGPVLVIADEWLDDLPCVVATRRPDGWHEVVVASDGSEDVGSALAGSALEWAERWWPHGDRAEIGLTRDQAWRAVVAAVVTRGGCAVMIDYGHRLPDRPRSGTLTAYRDGRQVSVAPSRDRNLTAHVAVDALQAAGEAAGGTTVWRGRQSDRAVAERVVPVGDPLLDLVRRSQESTLDQAWGDHWWLIQQPADMGA